MSIAALPPTNGFVSEWLVFQSLFLSVQLPPLLLKLMLPIAAAMLADWRAGAGVFCKSLRIVIPGAATQPRPDRAKEVPWSMRAGMGFLAGPASCWDWRPCWSSPVGSRDRAADGVSISAQVLALDGWVVAPVTVEFSSISTPVLAVLLVGPAGWGADCPSMRKGPACTVLQDLGLRAEPDAARMEYSAMGFAQPIKQVFETIYQPAVKLEREFLEQSKYFIKHQRFESHIRNV